MLVFRLRTQAHDRGQLSRMVSQARKLPDLRLGQQERQDRLGALVFVGAIGMQAVPAAPGFDVHQRYGKIVRTMEPREGASGFPHEEVSCVCPLESRSTSAGTA